MTNNEIDYKLARAIGWPEIETYPIFGVCVAEPCDSRNFLWRRFDHLDWHVAGPIAAKYNCFPELFPNDKQWCADDGYTESPVPQTAIALAVIREAGG